MAGGDASPRPPPRGVSRWRPATAAPGRPYRLAFRLIGIPIVAVCGVLIYRGVQERFFLPGCDSERAKKTLGSIFQELKVEPLHYAQIKTISSNRREVVCNAVLSLPDGANLNVDYSFFWQGDKANMKYSISRRERQSPAKPPAVPAR